MERNAGPREGTRHKCGDLQKGPQINDRPTEWAAVTVDNYRDPQKGLQLTTDNCRDPRKGPQLIAETCRRNYINL